MPHGSTSGTTLCCVMSMCSMVFDERRLGLLVVPDVRIADPFPLLLVIRRVSIHWREAASPLPFEGERLDEYRLVGKIPAAVGRPCRSGDLRSVLWGIAM